ncbi:DUF1833 domain-containing protein [Patescibacteria group bacterium]|nr:DUF1833 domain-containing protein [Patescibacteria group bacterium]
MSRNLSLTARQAIFAQETAEVFLLLLTIDHDDLDAAIRVVNNAENITSNSLEYQAFPFEMNLPDDTEDALSQVTLTICNVDRQIVQAVRSISSPPTVTLNVILASDPDTVEAGPFEFTMKSADYDALTVTGSLAAEDILNEPFPADRYTPNLFPGLFQ